MIVAEKMNKIDSIINNMRNAHSRILMSFRI